VKLPSIEAGISEFYRHMQIDTNTADGIRELVTTELDAELSNAAEQMTAATRSKAKLERERTKLLEAHYAGAIPLDMLKSEMDRLTRGLNAADKELAKARQTRTDIARLLDAALKAVTTCHTVYGREGTRPFVRRMLNQGFFSKVYIDEDGSVSDGEIQEPFAHILAHLNTVFIDKRKSRVRHILGKRLQELQRTGTDNLPDRTITALAAEVQTSRSAVLLSFDRDKQNRPTLSGGPGLNDEHLAEAEGFELCRTLLSSA
jgi:site-specific DNA recombinase